MKMVQKIQYVMKKIQNSNIFGLDGRFGKIKKKISAHMENLITSLINFILRISMTFRPDNCQFQSYKPTTLDFGMSISKSLHHFPLITSKSMIEIVRMATFSGIKFNSSNFFFFLTSKIVMGQVITNAQVNK